MKSFEDLDCLLATMDVAVRGFALRDVPTGAGHDAAPISALTVYYVISGTLHIAIPGRGSRICGPGWVILCPPGYALDFTVGNGEPAKVATGTVTTRLSGSFGLLDRAKVPVLEDMSRSGAVHHACLSMVEEFSVVPPLLGTRALVGALMKSVILAVLRRFFRRPGISQNLLSALADPRLAGAVAAVLDDPGAPHTIATLAAKAGLGRSTFARYFRERLGYSPMDFVARTRMHHAADLLRTGETPIKVIAAAIGFSSRSHFSRTFRDAHGLDPSAYRRQHLAAGIV